MSRTHRVTLKPVDIEIDVNLDETILGAAFRQGLTLAHGCKEGQCSACKAYIIDGDTDLAKYSTFALSDMERDEGFTLLCKTHVYSDAVIELLHFDEESLRNGIPIQTVSTEIEKIEELTHDIRLLRLKLLAPAEMTFHAGQYVDVHVPGTDQTRAFSMANTPASSDSLEFIIKLYPGGLFSGLLEGTLKPGDALDVTGPYGTCTLREQSERDIIMIGGGAGMAPLWSLLSALAERGSTRSVAFYYGARAKRDVFYIEELGEIAKRLPNFSFVIALSDDSSGNGWAGERGLITDVVDRLEGDLTEHEAYVCGPPPMVDASMALLERRGIPADRIFYDKFTITASAEGVAGPR